MGAPPPAPVHGMAMLSSSAGGGGETLQATEISLDPLLQSFGCMEEIR